MKLTGACLLVFTALCACKDEAPEAAHSFRPKDSSFSVASLDQEPSASRPAALKLQDFMDHGKDSGSCTKEYDLLNGRDKTWVHQAFGPPSDVLTSMSQMEKTMLYRDYVSRAAEGREFDAMDTYADSGMSSNCICYRQGKVVLWVYCWSDF